MLAICYANAMLTIHLTPKDWPMLDEWIGKWQSRTPHGAVIVDGDYYGWGVDDEQPASCREALLQAIWVLLGSKEFVDDKHACDDPYSVLGQIPETLRMRERLGETPHSFTELVRWASHDVR